MPQKAQSIQTIIQGAQLVALIFGIAAVMTTIGRRDAQITRNIEDISELRKISEVFSRLQLLLSLPINTKTNNSKAFSAELRS